MDMYGSSFPKAPLNINKLHKTGAIGFAAVADDFLPCKIISFLKAVKMKFMMPVRIHTESQFTILFPQ